KEIFPKTERGTQPLVPTGRRVGPDTDVALLHPVIANGRKPASLLGLEQPDMDVVIAALHANARLGFEAGKTPIEAVPGIETANRAAIELVELVTIDGIVEEVREVVVQLQVGADQIGADLALTVLAGMREIAGKAETTGNAAIGRIERAQPIDDTLIDRALSHLVSRIPGIGIGHAGPREPVGRGALAVAQDAVDLANIVWHVPRPVVFRRLDRREQRTVPDCSRARRQGAS